MKEATGELSGTVITVVAIALISSLFAVFLYPQLKKSIILNQACSNGNGYIANEEKYSVKCGTTKETTTHTETKGSKVCNADDTGSNQFTCYYYE